MIFVWLKNVFCRTKIGKILKFPFSKAIPFAKASTRSKMSGWSMTERNRKLARD
jgi:hypothetical protein